MGMLSLGEMSFYGAVMIIAVLIIRRLGRYRLPKRTFLLLWAVVLVRLLVPAALPAPFAHAVLSETAPVLPQAQQTQIVQTVPLGEGVLPQTAVGTVERTIAADGLQLVWLLGLAACALYCSICYYRCHRRFQTSLPVEQPFVQAWLEKHPLRRPLSIRSSDRIMTPLTYGYWHPVILLPKGMDQQDTQQLSYILQHEYIHICRWDGLTKLLLTAAVCLHWFDPLVWVMYQLANRDLELACDETLLRQLGEGERTAYARTLIRLEECKNHYSPLYSHFNEHTTEERIRAIMTIQRPSWKKTLLSAVLAGGLLLGLATNAAPAQAHYQTEPYSKAEALTELMDSVVKEGSFVCFTLPGEYQQAEDWQIIIAGRWEDEIGFLTSEHLLEKENQTHDWGAGRTYMLPMNKPYIELTLTASLPGESARTIDLLTMTELPTGVLTTQWANNEAEASSRMGAAITGLQADGTLADGEEAESLKAFEKASAQIAAQIEAMPSVSSQAPRSMVWPCPSSYKVTSPYGTRVHPITGEETLHSGVDILADEASSIVAAMDGQVIAAGYDKIYGNYIIVDHGGGTSTLYGQMSAFVAHNGDAVTAGQQIGKVGSTGQSTGAHLHFEIRINGEPVSPNSYLGI